MKEVCSISVGPQELFLQTYICVHTCQALHHQADNQTNPMLSQSEEVLISSNDKFIHLSKFQNWGLLSNVMNSRIFLTPFCPQHRPAAWWGRGGLFEWNCSQSTGLSSLSTADGGSFLKGRTNIMMILFLESEFRRYHLLKKDNYKEK